MIRYIIKPGDVLSDFHKRYIYVSAYDLMRFYGVDAEECAVLPDYPRDTKHYVPSELEGLPVLEPRASGVYFPISRTHQ